MRAPASRPRVFGASRLLRALAPLGALTALALALGAAVGPPAGAAEAARVEEVKAAFVVNFLRYTEWPATSFETSDSPFVVLVIGAEPVGEALEEIARRSAPIAGRPLIVERRRLPGRGSWRVRPATRRAGS